MAPLIKKVPKDYVGRVITTPYDEYLNKHAAKIILKHVAIAFLPILSLLALGWSFAWMRRGFIKDSPVSTKL